MYVLSVNKGFLVVIEGEKKLTSIREIEHSPFEYMSLYIVLYILLQRTTFEITHKKLFDVYFTWNK